MRNTLAKGAGVNSLLIKLLKPKPNAKTKAKAEARKALFHKGSTAGKINSAESIYLFKINANRVYALSNCQYYTA
jgi:hypothetical protein